MKTNVIRLDVGGTFFTTSLSTVTSTPANRLARLVLDRLICTTSNAHNNSPVEKPIVVIDRDGSHFRYILNYLRDADRVCLPSDSDTLEELLTEVEYYQLYSLKKLIMEKQKRLLANNDVHRANYGFVVQSPAKLSSDEMKPDRQCRNVQLGFDQENIPSIDEEPMCDTNGLAVNHFPNFTDLSNLLPLQEGHLVRWNPEGFSSFWLAISTSVATKGYVDYLFCSHCDNDYEVRLPEMTEPIFGWEKIREFLEPMCGLVDSICNDSCAYVAWRHVYCAKDGYLDSVKFNLHVPMTALRRFQP